MNRMYRLSMALVVVFLLAFAAGCNQSSQQQKQPAAPGASAGPAATAFIPSGMDFVARVDWAGITSNLKTNDQTKKDLKEGIVGVLSQKDPVAAEVFQALDLDLYSDVEGMAFGLVINPQKGDEPDLLAAFKSKLSLDKLVSVLKEKRADKVTITPFDKEGVKGYMFQTPHKPSEPPAYLTEQSGAILAGTSPAMLKKAVEASKSGDTAFSGGKTSEALGLIDKTAQITFALDGTKLPKEEQGPGAMQGANDIQTAAGSVKYGGQTWDIAFVSRFSDPNKAQAASEQVTMAKGMFSFNPIMKTLLDKVMIAAQGNDLKINASITDSEIEQLKKQVEQQMQQMQQMQPGR